MHTSTVALMSPPMPQWLQQRCVATQYTATYGSPTPEPPSASDIDTTRYDSCEAYDPVIDLACGLSSVVTSNSAMLVNVGSGVSENANMYTVSMVLV